MNNHIRESDWKLLRDLKPLALERLCERILGEIAAVTIATSRGAHERYLDVFKLIERRDKQIVNAFDGLSRSNAIVKLATMRSYSLLTDEEFQRFSDDTREVIKRILAP